MSSKASPRQHTATRRQAETGPSPRIKVAAAPTNRAVTPALPQALLNITRRHKLPEHKAPPLALRQRNAIHHRPRARKALPPERPQRTEMRQKQLEHKAPRPEPPQPIETNHKFPALRVRLLALPPQIVISPNSLEPRERP